METESIQKPTPELFEIRRTKLALYMWFGISIILCFTILEQQFKKGFSMDLDKDLIATFGAMIGLILSFLLNRYGESRIKKRIIKKNALEHSSNNT